MVGWRGGASGSRPVFPGSSFWARRLAALFGLLEPVGLAFEGHDFTAMDEALDEGDDAGGAGEDVVPLREGFIRGDGRPISDSMVASYVHTREQLARGDSPPRPESH